MLHCETFGCFKGSVEQRRRGRGVWCNPYRGRSRVRVSLQESKQDEEIHREARSSEDETESTSARGRDKHSEPFLMIRPQLLLVSSPRVSFVIPWSSFFLSDFISRPFSELLSCFEITLLPKGERSSIILLCLSPSLSCLLSSWGPKSPPPSCHLRPPSPLLSLPPSSPHRPLPQPSPPKSSNKTLSLKKVGHGSS